MFLNKADDDDTEDEDDDDYMWSCCSLMSLRAQSCDGHRLEFTHSV